MTRTAPRDPDIYRGYRLVWTGSQYSIYPKSGEAVDTALTARAAEKIIDSWLDAR